MPVELSQNGQVALLRLNNGVTNAINPELVQEVLRKLEVARQNAKGLVLAGGDKFFSIGLDLPLLLQFDRPSMKDFFTAFNLMLLNIFTLPIPTASVTRGHAVAGGMVIAIVTDFRVAAEGRTLYGLNEIKLGVTVPYLAELALLNTVSGPDARNLLYGGDFIESAQAHQIGLVDHVCPRESCEQLALGKIALLSGQPASSFASIKADMIEQTLKTYEEKHHRKHEQFLELWFSPAGQVQLKEAAQKFSQKSASSKT